MTDLLKAISGGGFAGIVAWIFPSALALGLFWLLVYPQLDRSLHFLDGLEATEATVIFAASAIGLGLALDAMSTPLYRILEGYSWRKPCQERGIKKQLVAQADLENEKRVATIEFEKNRSDQAGGLA